MAYLRNFLLVVCLGIPGKSYAFSSLAAIYLAEKGLKLGFVYWLATKKNGDPEAPTNSVDFYLDHMNDDDLRSADIFATTVRSDLQQLKEITIHCNDYIKRFHRRQARGEEAGRRMRGARALLDSYASSSQRVPSLRARIIGRYRQLLLFEIRRIERRKISSISINENQVGLVLLELIQKRLEAGTAKETVLEEIELS